MDLLPIGTLVNIPGGNYKGERAKIKRYTDKQVYVKLVDTKKQPTVRIYKTTLYPPSRTIYARHHHEQPPAQAVASPTKGSSPKHKKYAYGKETVRTIRAEVDFGAKKFEIKFKETSRRAGAANERVMYVHVILKSLTPTI